MALGNVIWKIKSLVTAQSRVDKVDGRGCAFLDLCSRFDFDCFISEYPEKLRFIFFFFSLVCAKEGGAIQLRK